MGVEGEERALPEQAHAWAVGGQRRAHELPVGRNRQPIESRELGVDEGLRQVQGLAEIPALAKDDLLHGTQGLLAQGRCQGAGQLGEIHLLLFQIVEASEPEHLEEEVPGGGALPRRCPQALRLSPQATRLHQTTALGSLQQGVIGRGVPQEKGKTGRQLPAIEGSHARNRTSGADLDSIEEVRRLEQRSQPQRESLPEIAQRLCRLAGELDVAAHLLVGERPSPGPPAKRGDELSRAAFVDRAGGRTRNQPLPSVRIRKRLLGDADGRALQPLDCAPRIGGQRGADLREAAQGRVRLEIGGHDDVCPEQIANGVRVLRAREPAQPGRREARGRVSRRRGLPWTGDGDLSWKTFASGRRDRSPHTPGQESEQS